MSDAPYTEARDVQYRGPSTSEDYNQRIEENYRDLVVLYNRARLYGARSQEAYRRLLKEHLELIRFVDELDQRVIALEAVANQMNFYTSTQLDTDRFNSTGFAISVADRLSAQTKYGLLTLPKVESSSLSKLSYFDNNGEARLPSTLQTNVIPDATTADSATATIDTSLPEYAVLGDVGRIWERNVVVDAPNVNGARLSVYVKVPTDLFTTDKSNVLTIDPFPLMGTDIEGVYLTTKASPNLTEEDGYTAVNSTAIYSGVTEAVGWVAPGGWANDAALYAAPKKFYFDPQVVTAFKIKLRRPTYYVEGTKYIYSYGASVLDLGYDKFLSTGKAILRFDAPDGDTISSVTSVDPHIYNVAESDVPDVFDYRVIWETSYNSGSYTLTPVPLSNRVWVEVTLTETTGKGTPALSGLTVSYS